MTTAANAWILTDHDGNAFAVSEMEMIAYLISPPTLAVPMTPGYCGQVTPWRDRLLPVLHYNRLFAPTSHVESRHVGVLAYQTAPGQPINHIAVSLGQSPYRVSVSEQPCAPLPDNYTEHAYRPMVRSVFCHEETLIPIVNVAYLASTSLRDALRTQPASPEVIAVI